MKKEMEEIGRIEKSVKLMDHDMRKQVNKQQVDFNSMPIGYNCV